jgi:hypothetical protein
VAAFFVPPVSGNVPNNCVLLLILQSKIKNLSALPQCAVDYLAIRQLSGFYTPSSKAARRLPGLLRPKWSDEPTFSKKGFTLYNTAARAQTVSGNSLKQSPPNA